MQTTITNAVNFLKESYRQARQAGTNPEEAVRQAIAAAGEEFAVDTDSDIDLEFAPPAEED